MKKTYKRLTFRLLAIACAILGVTACSSKKPVVGSPDSPTMPPTKYGPPPSIHISSGSGTDAPADNPGFHIGP